MSQKTTKAIARVIAILLALALVVSTFTYVFGTEVYAAGDQGNTDAYLESETEALKSLVHYIEEHYKDEVSYTELMSGAFKGVMEALGDPYSVYYLSVAESEEFLDSVNGQFNGIGVSITMENERCKVVAPLPGTPAETAGIRSGDIITRVDDMDVSGLTLSQVSTLLKGEKGTKVKVTVERDGISMDFVITRATISTSAVSYELLEDDIGYIQIKEFDADSQAEFTEAKLKLIAAGARSFIVDVRNNPGGYVSAAINIANQLMPKGDIMHFEQRGEIIETYKANGQGLTGVPVVLLVNEGSASASEILAGAWKDSQSATLVGTTTYGKGVAQQVVELENEGAIKLSMYYFLTPKKHVIDGVGISPDYVVENYSQAEAEILAEQYLSFAPMTEDEKPGPGDTGLNVYGAQQRLAMLGYEVSVTGTMDEATVAAVKGFQTDAGLYSYGVVDYTTRNAIDKAAVTMASGAGAGEDRQLKRAVELLTK